MKIPARRRAAERPPHSEVHGTSSKEPTSLPLGAKRFVIIWPRALARLKCSAEVIRCGPARTHSFPYAVPTGITLKQSFQTCDRVRFPLRRLLFRHVEEAQEPQEKPTPARTSDWCRNKTARLFREPGCFRAVPRTAPVGGVVSEGRWR